MEQTETLDQTSVERGLDNAIRSDKSLKILIVESDPTDLIAMRRMLGAGYGMFAELGNASSLAEALAALDQQCPDVVLLELDLPDSRGLDTVHKLMAHSTHPVCIIVTDCQSEQTESEAIALGVQDYIMKVDLIAKSLSLAIRHAVDRRCREDRLHESEEKFRMLFALSRDAIMILDRRGFLDCNQATLDVFGCSSRDQFISRHPSELSPSRQTDGKDSAQAARDRIEAAYVSGNQCFEWLHQRIDGTVFPAEVQLSRVKINGTQVIQAVVRDITERKRIVQENNRLVHDLNERVKELNCMLGVSGLIEQYGSNLEGMCEGVVHLLAAAYQYPEITCARVVFENMEFKTGNFKDTKWKQSTNIKVHGKEAGLIEVCYLEEMPVSYEGPFQKEERALLEGVAGRLGRFIDRKEVDDALRESWQLIDGIISAIPARVFWKDKNLVYLGCNAAFARDAGFADPKAIIGKDDYQMVWRDQAELYRGDDRQVIESGCSKILIEEPQTTPKGDTIHLLTSKVALYSSGGKVIGVLGTYLEITDRKRAEQRQAQLMDQLKHVNQELNDFAYTVSHDLKAPLRGITTLADWVVSDCSERLDEEGKENLRTIQERVRKMTDLIDGVLRYSRACSGEDTHVDVDLKAVVDEAVNSLAVPPTIDVTIETPLPTVRGDKTRIGQVFQNLLGNAIKYMDKPQGNITVGCVEEDGFWKFSVSDNGVGIEEAYHEIIFKMFKTAPNHKDQDSTGVGLTIAEKIVMGMGGRIWVESEVGRGSTFYFTLPKATSMMKGELCEANCAG